MIAIDAAVLDYAASGRAENTRRAYKADRADCERWCVARALDPLPASTAQVGVYLASLAGGLKSSSIGRGLAALVAWHREHGHLLETASGPAAKFDKATP